MVGRIHRQDRLFFCIINGQWYCCCPQMETTHTYTGPYLWGKSNFIGMSSHLKKSSKLEFLIITGRPFEGSLIEDGIIREEDL